ncbi:MAG: tyrosine-type recombinase/integrase [Muribaculaceae bacterium]|nr:tyrosine-type recombinase/integrase [Muribaculaceae bacterium]
METNYFLRNKLSGNVEETLYFRIRRRVPVVDILISTQTKVNVSRWNNATLGNDAERLQKFLTSPYGKGIISKCDAAYNVAVALVVGDGVTDRKIIKDAVFRAVNAEAIAQADRAKHAAESNVMQCLNRFIAGITDGTITFKRMGVRRYTDGSVGRWNSFQKMLTSFYKDYPFTWEQIDEEFNNIFLAWLQAHGYMKATINKMVSGLKTLALYYLGRCHDNTAVRECLCGLGEADTEEKAAEIYLTAEEINALYDMQLCGNDGIVRDIFLVGCFTGQRVSDYATIKAEDFGTTSKGTEVIRIKQQKTGKRVVIPILDTRLKALAEKYNYNFPQISPITINIHIKNICAELAESVPTLRELVRTKLTMKDLAAEKTAGKELYQRDELGNAYKYKWQLVSTHTARRSAITLMYASNKFTARQVMAVSGHSTESMLMRYVKLSGDEKADDLADSASDGLF